MKVETMSPFYTPPPLFSILLSPPPPLCSLRAISWHRVLMQEFRVVQDWFKGDIWFVVARGGMSQVTRKPAYHLVPLISFLTPHLCVVFRAHMQSFYFGRSVTSQGLKRSWYPSARFRDYLQIKSLNWIWIRIWMEYVINMKLYKSKYR